MSSGDSRSPAAPFPEIALRARVHSEVDGGTSDLLFADFPVRIGRHRLNELVLNHPYVSQWHAVIGCVGGTLTVTQVGSTNSVRVRTLRLGTNEEVALRGEETIRIVPFSITLKLVPYPEELKRPRSPTSSIEAEARQAGQGEAARAQTALRVVDRLAQHFLGVTLDDPEQLVQFGLGLEQTLDVFLRCLIALRKGQEQFRSALDIRALAPSAEDRVQRANSPAELAAALLAPKSQGAAALERTFKDIMIHQVALLNGVMAGVRSLLGKISPKTIHKAAARHHRSPSWRTLWEAFEREHQELMEEDSTTFEAIFGRQFDRAYATVARKKGSETTS